MNPGRVRGPARLDQDCEFRTGGASRRRSTLGAAIWKPPVLPRPREVEPQQLHVQTGKLRQAKSWDGGAESGKGDLVKSRDFFSASKSDSFLEIDGGTLASK